MISEDALLQRYVQSGDYKMLLGLHRLYSRALLAAARSRLQ